MCFMFSNWKKNVATTPLVILIFSSNNMSTRFQRLSGKPDDLMKHLSYMTEFWINIFIFTGNIQISMTMT